jgi:formimidoylglutamate deiminase
MPTLWAETALLPDGWARDVRLEVGADGSLVAVRPGDAGEDCERLAGTVVPGMPDLHCHAFQRAMAGLAQRLEPGEASFWTWRETMYRFLERLRPEDVAAIAAQLYVELLEGGYTTVVEFHYLHHDRDGRPYADPASMAWAVDAGAREAGIALTLLPVVYMTGGFDGRELEGGQRRFRLDPAGALDLLQRLARRLGDDPDRALGLAPHSLRAVPPAALVEAVRGADPSWPLHIHVAEQVREVRDCLEATGRRSLARLADLVELGERWCLVHATHLDDEEVLLLAGSGAVAGLCPTTEADLGDGLFRLPEHLDGGGRLGIGSDSNVGTDAFAELRLLEYGQRLTSLRRLVAASEAEPSTGGRLWRTALAGGAQASGRPIGRLVPGCRADLLVLDGASPTHAGLAGDRLLDAVIFGPGRAPIRDVMVGGRWVVRDGVHPRRAAIGAAYRDVLARLLG